MTTALGTPDSAVTPVDAPAWAGVGSSLSEVLDCPGLI